MKQRVLEFPKELCYSVSVHFLSHLNPAIKCGTRMRKIPVKISYGKYAYALVDDSDYAYLSKFNWILDRGYAYRYDWIKKKQRWFSMAREIMGLKTGDKRTVDHINRSRLDNRRKNLRIATRAQQRHNEGLRIKNTSGFRGVSQISNGRFRAYCGIGGTRIHLGYFDSAKEAGKVAKEFRLSNLSHAVD